MEFFEAVRKRRSVRRYTTKPVPREVMDKAFEAAQMAPNSSNLQTWEFHWVRNPELKAKLAVACLNQGAARTAAELVVVVSKKSNWKRNNRELLTHLESLNSPALKLQRQYYGKLIPFLYGFRWLSPFKWVLFHTIGLFKPASRRPTSGRDLDEVSIKSAALGAENFMLAIAAQDFDTCPMEGFDEVRVRNIIKSGCCSRVVMVISVGERDPKGIWGTQYRFPRDWFVKEHT